MKTSKRILSLFLTIVMMLSIVPLSTVQSSAAYENTYKNTGNQRADIIGVALTQKGYKEGNNNSTKYGTWYGLPNQPWCAMFVSWCARQAGIPTSVLKNSAVAAPDAQYFNIPYYNGSSYTPKSGDLFFTKDWSHVGLVASIDGNYFYSIEGNYNDSVCQVRRKISDYYFGVPNYGKSQTTLAAPTNVQAASCGNKLRVTWNAVSGANCYDVIVTDPNGAQNWYHASGTNRDISITKLGTYKIEVQSLYRPNGTTANQIIGEHSKVIECAINIFGPNAIKIDIQNSNFRVTWDAVTGANCYDVIVTAPDGVTNWYHTDKPSKIIPIFSKPGVYKFKVQSLNRLNGSTTGQIVGGYSPEVTYALELTAPQNVYADNADGKFNVYWDLVAGATCYDVVVTKPNGEVQYFHSHSNKVSIENFEYGHYSFWIQGIYRKDESKVGQVAGPHSITVDYDYTSPVTISSISIQSKPTKTVYTVGEKFDASGLKIKVTMSDGTAKTITSGFTLSNPDMSTAGTKTVTVTYSGKTASFTITVNNPPATVSSIAIQSKPTKTVYTVGEKFDASGLAVKVTMSDGTTKTITSGFTLSNPDMSTAGTKTVTVSYSGKTTTFTITVKTATTGTLRAEISNRAVLGQTVDIPLYVDCNAALGTIKFQVQYDKTKLQYISCNENVFKNSVVNDNDPGKLVVACVTASSVPVGKICVLRFKVIASSAGNTNLNFSALEATDSVDAPINMSGGSYTLPLVQRYTVTYNANGGTGAPAAQTKYTGDSLKLSSVKPTRTGYTFLGWATSATATSAQYAAGGTYTGNANLTLYAVWKANTYTVTYNANGGTGTTASSSHTYDTAKVLSANGFTRTGYTFLGWSTSASATTATYTNRQSVKNLTATNGETVTLYAVWQKNPATVSSIAIQSKPTKTVYTVGEKFDASGLKIKVTMSDGTAKTITSGFTLSNPDMSKAGTKSVTVTYSGKTVSFTITVKDANPPANTGALRLITPASARVGQRVQIPVQLDKASLGTLTFTVKYDHTKLKYVSCTESTFDMCDVYSGNTGVIRAACIDNDAVSAGRIAVLTFEVIAPSACLTDLTLTVEEAYDGSDKAVSVTGGTWELSVVKTVLGDLNGDGQVTAIDARWALQAASGTRTLNEEQKAAADINGDGKITAIDARWILQAASGTRVL